MPQIPDVRPSPTRTRLQAIAYDYVQRYWARLHPDDRLAVIVEHLTRQEQRALLARLAEETHGGR